MMKSLGVFVAIIAFQCISTISGVTYVELARNMDNSLSTISELNGSLVIANVAGSLREITQFVYGLNVSAIQVFVSVNGFLPVNFGIVTGAVSSLNAILGGNITGLVETAFVNVSSSCTNLAGLVGSLTIFSNTYATIDAGFGSVVTAVVELFYLIVIITTKVAAAAVSAAIAEAVTALVVVFSTVLLVVLTLLAAAAAVIQTIFGIESVTVLTIVPAVYNTTEVVAGVVSTIAGVVTSAVGTSNSSAGSANFATGLGSMAQALSGTYDILIGSLASINANASLGYLIDFTGINLGVYVEDLIENLLVV